MSDVVGLNWFNRTSIVAEKLVDVVRLFEKSSGDPSISPRLDLPSIQRNGVWTPAKVLDLWDSVLRGFPIGTFYIVERSKPRMVRSLALRAGTQHAGTFETGVFGYELLDGQQRMRALVAGLAQHNEDRRCVWVDVSKLRERTREGRAKYLLLSSKAQPFGYDAETGQKLGVDDRRNARAEIERSKQKPLRYRAKRGGGTLRDAYDSDLFDDSVGEVIQFDDKPIKQPPRPYRGNVGKTFPLWKLFDAWERGRLAELPNIGPEEASELEKRFHHLAGTEIALLKVPTDFQDEKRDILDLFRRIGAGGAPLTEEERLYSTYKHYVPRVHDAVNHVEEQAGRVLPAVKIAMTALRIANAESHSHKTDVPSEVDFVEAMAAVDNPAKPGSLRSRLEALLPPSSGTEGTRPALAEAFAALTSLLRRPDGEDQVSAVGAFWMPDVLLAALPVELWQVLAFYAVRNGGPALPDADRPELVRFVLFWQACVFDPKKAATAAFEHFKSASHQPGTFPGKLLYERLTGGTGTSFAHKLPCPSAFTTLLTKKGESAVWRADDERFGPPNARDGFAYSWWHRRGGGERILPYLQREYIWRAFRGYAPLTDHEDDLPYDVDHICPRSNWGWWWGSGKAERNIRVDHFEVDQVRKRFGDLQVRNALGDGIGNLRLVASSHNRSDGDKNHRKKMPAEVLRDESLRDADRDLQLELARWSFGDDHERSLWNKAGVVSDALKEVWDHGRLEAFQAAVEHRAARLYRDFYLGLGFSAWHNAAVVDPSDSLESPGV